MTTPSTWRDEPEPGDPKLWPAFFEQVKRGATQFSHFIDWHRSLDSLVAKLTQCGDTEGMTDE